MSNKINIKYKGNDVDCFGDMSPEQNISVVCDDEFDDGIVAEGFDNWTQAVHKLVDCGRFPSGIVQLESI